MLVMSQQEFQEIAHSGGQVVIHVKTDEQGKRGYSLSWQHSRPVAAAVFAVYALPQGIAVGTIRLGGIGQPSNPAPVSGCFQVFIGSDSQGKFGHQCPACDGYWRGDHGAECCPYCGIHAPTHQFLSKAQKSYVEQYCARIREALSTESDGEYVIDMDVVADAVGQKTDKPPFYYAEVSQQNKFTCTACGAFNDILGRFGYCSVCGTRNDLQELTSKILPSIRDRINTRKAYEDCVRDSIAAFDSFVGQFVAQLVQHVPMTPARTNRLEKRRYHNLQLVATDIREIFDIDILDGIKPDDVEFAKLMFNRRHVYEHKGGEADEKYIEDSGDKSVRPKQVLHETIESAHRIVGLVSRMAENLHIGFHNIFPPEEKPIQQFQRRRRTKS
jgi:hypothetical protein